MRFVRCWLGWPLASQFVLAFRFGFGLVLFVAVVCGVCLWWFRLGFWVF